MRRLLVLTSLLALLVAAGCGSSGSESGSGPPANLPGGGTATVAPDDATASGDQECGDLGAVGTEGDRIVEVKAQDVDCETALTIAREVGADGEQLPVRGFECPESGVEDVACERGPQIITWRIERAGGAEPAEAAAGG